MWRYVSEGAERQNDHTSKFENRSRHMFTAAARRAGVEACQARAAERAAKLAPIIAELQADGVTSVSGIAAALRARGVRTPTGRRYWYASQVALLLKRSKATRDLASASSRNPRSASQGEGSISGSDSNHCNVK
jgi:hypothetical protein